MKKIMWDIKYSVPGYWIFDKENQPLFNGNVVQYSWGGGNDGKRYRLLEFHTLTISLRGKLSISGCQNMIRGSDLVKIVDPENDRDFKKWGLNARFKDYY